MSELASVQAKVHGFVQGVFFRDFTRRQARGLGLTGYVRNLPDGTVTLQAEGEEEKLKELVNRLRTGPPGARVDRVDISWSEYTGNYHHFDIKY
jgi:acylphosphatase